MAKTVKVENEGEQDKIDFIAAAQPSNNIQNPVLKYEDMTSQPDYRYRINADEWISIAPENWQERYKDKWFYKIGGDIIYDNLILPNIDGLKTAEKEVLLDNIFTTGYMALRKSDLRESKNLATTLRDKVYIYNDKEPTALKAYSAEDANIDGSKPNALLHTMWSALLTYEFNDKIAEKITTAHEMLDKEQYAGNKIYSQPEIAADVEDRVYTADKKYPLLKQHMEMDLHNNALGREIANEVKSMTNAEVNSALENYYSKGDNERYFDTMFPELNDKRKRLLFLKCLEAVQKGDAAIIWDKYGKNTIG